MSRSRHLKATLARARALADRLNHREATVDHLLVALTEDPDAGLVLQACDAEPDRLRQTLLATLADPGGESTGQEDPVDAIVIDVTERLLKVGRPKTVTGADVLAEILAAGAATPAMEVLQRHGITRLDVLTYVSHGLRKSEAAPSANAGDAKAPMHEVRILNDNYTPIDFVIEALERVLGHDNRSAAAAAMHTHSVGRGSCGTYPAEIATTKAIEITNHARAHQHPLRCVSVPVGR